MKTASEAMNLTLTSQGTGGGVLGMIVIPETNHLSVPRQRVTSQENGRGH